jgi:hypothetical protein
MHLFNDIFQSLANDLNEICEDLNGILFDDYYLVRLDPSATAYYNLQITIEIADRHHNVTLRQIAAAKIAEIVDVDSP